MDLNGDGSCQFTLSDGQIYKKKTAGYDMNAASLIQSSQKIRRVELYYLDYAHQLLSGMIFFAENGNEICRTGCCTGFPGFVDRSIKTIELQAEERIIGFRAAPLDQNSFGNFQFLLAKSD